MYPGLTVVSLSACEYRMYHHSTVSTCAPVLTILTTSLWLCVTQFVFMRLSDIFQIYFITTGWISQFPPRDIIFPRLSTLGRPVAVARQGRAWSPHSCHVLGPRISTWRCNLSRIQVTPRLLGTGWGYHCKQSAIVGRVKQGVNISSSDRGPAHWNSRLNNEDSGF